MFTGGKFRQIKHSDLEKGEIKMDEITGMTDKQLRTVFLLIIEILRSNNVDEKVIKKIESCMPRE